METMTDTEIKHLREHNKRLEQENRALRQECAQLNITLSGVRRSRVYDLDHDLGGMYAIPKPPESYL